MNQNHAMSPMYLAIEHQDLPELTRLLDAGADPNAVPYCNMTPLLHAIDAEGDATNQTGKPLHAGMTAILLAYGADPQLCGPDGGSPVELAQQYRHEMAIRLLRAHIDRGATLDNRGR